MEMPVSVFTDHAGPKTSANYKFISTKAVIDRLAAEGFVVHRAGQARVRDYSGAAYAKHVVTMRHGHVGEIGDLVYEVVVSNGHNANGCLAVFGGIHRAICKNGMVVSSVGFEDIRVRHSGNVDKVIEGTYRVIEQMPVVMGQVNQWRALETSLDQRVEFANRAVAVLGSSMAVDPLALIAPRRHEDTANDFWTVFNRAQEGIVRGGVSSVNSQGAFRRTRQVKSAPRHLELNRKLWRVAEDFVKEAA